MRVQSVRRENPPDEEQKVAGYLLIRRLARLVRADFAALPDEVAFWAQPEFSQIRVKKKEEHYRLTLEHVLARIGHCRQPHKWWRWYEQTKRGKLTLTQFVKKIIARSRYQHATYASE